jgi:hypothetical protein
MGRAALLAGVRDRAPLGGGMRAGSLLIALLMSGCIASTRNPERLIPVAVEMGALAADQNTLISAYDDAVRAGSPAARTIRNEIITRRMYAIDVQYTQYENALTREGQEIGFGALTAATGLSTAATLVAVNATKTILSAAATGVLATKGHYESEILIAQTIRTIQKQMRSSRNGIAANISAKMAQNAADYPLWAALSDVEDYYNAGTLTTGVIDVSTTVGNQENITKSTKEVVTQSSAPQRAQVLQEAKAATGTNVVGVAPRVFVAPRATDTSYTTLRALVFPGGVRDQAVVTYLQSLVGANVAVGPILTTDSPGNAALRRRMIACIDSRSSNNPCAAGSLSSLVAR